MTDLRSSENTKQDQHIYPQGAKINTKQTYRHVIICLQKTKDKKKIQKVTRERKKNIWDIEEQRYLSEVMQAPKQ